MATQYREKTALIPASASEVFAFVDDHSRLSSHMNQSSWRMGGGRMSSVLDEEKGQAVGSHIRMSGTVFGLRLSLDEVVTVRRPPTEKRWQTVGIPRLLVIGSYKMGIQITPANGLTRLRVFIDYDLPADWPASWLGRLFGGIYAGWCVGQMVDGAARHFGEQQTDVANTVFRQGS